MENFLTDDECDSIIDLAQYHGLKASTTVKTTKQRLPREKIVKLFYKNDLDGDGILEKYEVFGVISFLSTTGKEFELNVQLAITQRYLESDLCDRILDRTRVVTI